jgi:hypothetical protein
MKSTWPAQSPNGTNTAHQAGFKYCSNNPTTLRSPELVSRRKGSDPEPGNTKKNHTDKSPASFF